MIEIKPLKLFFHHKHSLFELFRSYTVHTQHTNSVKYTIIINVMLKTFFKLNWMKNEMQVCWPYNEESKVWDFFHWPNTKWQLSYDYFLCKLWCCWCGGDCRIQFLSRNNLYNQPKKRRHEKQIPSLAPSASLCK